VVWSLEIARVESYPTFPGEEFGQFLGNRARDLGLRAVIPAELLSRMAAGAVLAVGDLEIRYGPGDRSGRNSETRIALLTTDPDSDAAVWRIQARTRSNAVLLQALKTVTDDMLRTDDRVLTCLGGATPDRVPRATQLACIREVWSRDFGAER
jgi:hypothetical protein